MYDVMYFFLFFFFWGGGVDCKTIMGNVTCGLFYIFPGKVTRMHLVVHALKPCLIRKCFLQPNTIKHCFVLSSQTPSNMFE